MPSAAAVHGELITGPARGAPRRADQRPGPGPAVSSQEGLLMINLSWKLQGASWSLAPRLSSEGLAAPETDERPVGTPGHTDPLPPAPAFLLCRGRVPTDPHTAAHTQAVLPAAPRAPGLWCGRAPEPAAAEGRQQPPGPQSASPRAPTRPPPHSAPQLDAIAFISSPCPRCYPSSRRPRPTPLPATTDVFTVFRSFAFSRLLYSRNHRGCDLFTSASFTRS